MKEIAVIIKQKSLHPFSEEDLEILREYKPNQLVRVKIQGVRKPRSYVQLKLYWSACRLVSENTENSQWNTKEKVDFQCRVKTHFVGKEPLVAVRKNGDVVFNYASISFANLGHIEACNYFDQAFKVMAKFLGTTKDKLIHEVNNQ